MLLEGATCLVYYDDENISDTFVVVVLFLDISYHVMFGSSLRLYWLGYKPCS